MNLVKFITRFFFIAITIGVSFGDLEQHENIGEEHASANKVEDELAKKLYVIIEHFKQEDPIGLPLIPLTDPMEIPDQTQKMAVGTMKMTNSSVHGVKNFRVHEVSTEVTEMRAKCRLIFDLIQVKGNYSLSSFFTKSKGPFTINLIKVVIDGNAKLEVKRDGNLRVQSVVCDISFGDMKMKFENLGNLAGIFQSVMNSASNVIFDSVKPKLLAEATTKITEQIDNQLADFLQNTSLPNSLSPVDKFIYDFRTQFREKGYDPFQVKDHVHSGLFGIKIYNTWLFGLSSFYRLGELSLKILNNTAIITMNIGTQIIHGSSNWQVTIAKGMITRGGSVQFSVQHIKVMFQVSQPLDLRKKLKIEDIQVDLGNIQVRSNGLGTADYLVEFFVNVIPNLLRYQIVDALEKPMLRKLQDLTDEIDVEQLVKKKFKEYRTSGTVDMSLKEEL